jgi:hypothetical protein
MPLNGYQNKEEDLEKIKEECQLRHIGKKSRLFS